MRDQIRRAMAADSEAILGIYAPYIRDTAISFETEVPSIEAFTARVAGLCQTHPYLVYLRGGRIVGYAYAASHRERDAYRYDVDVSVYVLPECHGQGIAHRLYACLFDLLMPLGYYNAYAVCTLPNEKSLRFHQKMGFALIGIHHNTGYKMGQWRDVAWLERALRPHDPCPSPIASITSLPEETLTSILSRHNG